MNSQTFKSLNELISTYQQGKNFLSSVNESIN